MLTVLTGLLASVSWAVSDLLAQRVTRVDRPLRMMPLSLGVGSVALAPASVLIYGLPLQDGQWQPAAFAAAAGVVYLGAYSCLLAGLRAGDLSLVAALSASSGAFVVAFAMIGGEDLTPALAVGLALAVSGALLSATRDRFKTTAGAGWALASGFLFAAVLALYDRADGLSWLAVASYARAASFLVIVPIALIWGRRLLARPLRTTAAGAGLLEIVGVLLSALAIQLGPLSVAGVMSAQFATVAVLTGLLFLHERLRPHQLVGVALTLAGASVVGALA
jgi:drug/metabolite transporter (DMT)-like permease